MNVTPDKRQVMLHQEKAMIALVKVNTSFSYNNFVVSLSTAMLALIGTFVCARPLPRDYYCYIHDIVIGIADKTT